MFDEQSPFLQRDNRRQRPALRLTAELLNRRHGLLLPGPVVAQRSVLDLGCALAATGRWVLDAGASSYVGVELQKEYADTAAELLSRESSAKIVCEDARAFASKSGCQYDVVVMIGLLHGLFDPLDLLQCAARVAREFVCIETQGDDIAGASMTPSRQMRMPIAGKLASTLGFGWNIAPSALAVAMEHLGFVPDMAPAAIDHAHWGARYALRFKRGGFSTPAASDFANEVPWPAEAGPWGQGPKPPGRGQ